MQQELKESREAGRAMSENLMQRLEQGDTHLKQLQVFSITTATNIHEKKKKNSFFLSTSFFPLRYSLQSSFHPAVSSNTSSSRALSLSFDTQM
ncbi:hypothetical protein CSUI_011217 [Cystoisospora suis]|uniref:Uncharacterized protein n=1 Tax=Cystoisospora suis TaxID=483139 RepID=A0A2C6KF23_9APIC|nr:hypothetical protein CSUI_011217 [Cystoisospora suis]